MKKINLLIAFLCITGLAIVNSCKDNELFENNLFISSPKSETILNKTNSMLDERILISSIAHPENFQVDIQYGVAPQLVKQYNQAYNSKAILLPAEYYNFSSQKATINIAAVKSTPITVHFKDINKLNRDILYVLPVTINNSNVSVLQSAKTTFYVIQGGALINVVADLTSNYLHINNWVNAAPLNNLQTLTMETLVRAQNYDRMISTIMGIEGRFLIRLGDAGFPSNQIQVATAGGNFPSPDVSKGLPVNQWVHIAVTYKSESGRLKVFVNGKLQSSGTVQAGSVSFGVNGSNGFYIGRSYEDARYFAGEFAECRIWNVERTEQEIAENPYEVDPATTGLVAYWRFNEGAGNDVKDHTNNLNHLVGQAGKEIKWLPVSLPAKN